MNSLFILIASLLAGATLALAFNLPLAAMILATSPGLAEMTITAQALHINMPLVVAFHLFRES
ncbi:MAG TPA: AbrB family transcriptional regulator [Candidatus Binatia bacterium]